MNFTVYRTQSGYSIYYTNQHTYVATVSSVAEVIHEIERIGHRHYAYRIIDER